MADGLVMTGWIPFAGVEGPLIDIIRTLVDALVHGLPNLMGLREDKRRRRLGAELFLLYSKINQVVLTAEAIVGFLETYAESQPGPSQRFWPGTSIVPLLQKQAEDLRKVYELLSGSRRHAVVMQILEPDAHNRLAILLGVKQGALKWLIAMVRVADELPLEPSLDELAALARELPAPPTPPTEDNPSTYGFHWLMADGLVRHAGSRWEEGALPGREHWDAQIHARVTRYLAERKPREQVKEMRSCLSMLRSTLLEHFTLAEVMLEVGDARLGE